MSIIFVKFILGFCMSEGAFSITSYEADSGVTHPIRVQPESITALNPAGAALVSSVKFRRGGSRRKYGNFARFITIGRLIGALSNSGGSFAASTVYAKVTVFTSASFAQLLLGTTFTYAGKADWTIRSKNTERVV